MIWTRFVTARFIPEKMYGKAKSGGQICCVRNCFFDAPRWAKMNSLSFFALFKKFFTATFHFSFILFPHFSSFLSLICAYLCVLISASSFHHKLNKIQNDKFSNRKICLKISKSKVLTILKIVFF